MAGKTGWKLASMGGFSQEDLGREKCRGVDSPEMAIGCLTPVGTSDVTETHQSVLWLRSCSGARLKMSLQFHSGNPPFTPYKTQQLIRVRFKILGKLVQKVV